MRRLEPPRGHGLNRRVERIDRPQTSPLRLEESLPKFLKHYRPDYPGDMRKTNEIGYVIP
jgi:hypothetical protein